MIVHLYNIRHREQGKVLGLPSSRGYEVFSRGDPVLKTRLPRPNAEFTPESFSRGRARNDELGVIFGLCGLVVTFSWRSL